MLSIAFKAKVFKMGNRVAIDLTLSVVNRQLEADHHSSFRFIEVFLSSIYWWKSQQILTSYISKVLEIGISSFPGSYLYS